MRFRSKNSNICVSALTCVCLGNIILLYIFKNLQAEYVWQQNIAVQSRRTIEMPKEIILQKSPTEDESYIVNEPLLCNNQTVDLIIVVCSSLDHFKQRQAIRETWGNITQETFRVKLIFLVGKWTQKQFSRINASFFTETSKYKDLVQGNFIDSYRNLTLKSISMLRWVNTYCSHANYLLKVDDDMYINIPNLFSAIYKQVVKLFIMGNLIIGAKPVQDNTSKWYTPKKLFPEENYPHYVSGTAYVISGCAIPKIYSSAKSTKPFWLEDIFITGICAKKAGIHHIHRNDMTFDTLENYDCAFKSLISVHRIKWQHMYFVHHNVISGLRDSCDQNKI